MLIFNPALAVIGTYTPEITVTEELKSGNVVSSIEISVEIIDSTPVEEEKKEEIESDVQVDTSTFVPDWEAF